MLDEALLRLETAADHYYGKYRGQVTNVSDPQQCGRVKMKVPEVLGDIESGWAMPCTPYAGSSSGWYAIPPVGAPVWAEFEAGDPSRPIWAGGWWGPIEAPGTPASATPSPTQRALRSETGLSVVMDDDAGTLTVSDSTGQNLLQIQASGGQVQLQALTQVTLEAPAILHGQGAIEPAVLGQQLLSYLTQLTALFNTHIHPGEMALGVLPVTPAPPVAPFTPPPPSLLSMKNQVE
jgi:phage baseplate assembly protein gpV